MRYEFPLYMLSSTSPTFSQHAPPYERYAAKDLIQERGEDENCEGKYEVHTCRRHLGVCLHQIAKRYNYQIMNDIDAVARTRHVSCKSSCAVEASLEPSHHRKAHEPAVDVVERAAEVLRRGVVLAESCGDQYDSAYCSASHQRLPCMADLFLHSFMREHEISHEEREKIEERFVQVP